VGSLRDCTWILALPEYRVVELKRNDDGRLVIAIERRAIRRYVCSVCGRRTGRVRDAKVQTWDDLPWPAYQVTLRYALRRSRADTAAFGPSASALRIRTRA
jgi:transposase